MEINKSYNGFHIDHKEYIKEVNGNVYIMTHLETGAKLVFVNNNDEHKAFSIGFRTPPEDDTGVFHILEHCVLSGSRKFPIKEPMVELMKGSMKTYLNATTYLDKTLYSFASVNKKDFSNLIDVIMDSVFFPMLYEQKEIFLQEGWHLAYREETNDFKYKGIVYNEMKGALSSPQQRFVHSLLKALYPSDPQAKISGGDPQYITDLKYEKLLEAHQTYYHPSNSIVYLYGDVGIEERLQQINEVLSQFERKETIHEAPVESLQRDFREYISEYPISDKEIVSENTFLGYGFKLDDQNNKYLGITLSVLYNILLEGNSAILKKKLLEGKLGKDAFGIVDFSLKNPLFAICCSNGDVDNKESFIKVIRKTLQELVEKGIDKKLVEAAINSTAFNLREADYGTFPEGLSHGINAVSNWVADKSIFEAFQYEEALEVVKSALSEPYFERFIEKNFLDNKQAAVVICRPSKQLSKIEYEQEQTKLERVKRSLEEEDIQALIQENADLKKFQSLPDSEELKATLPTLLLSDLSPEPVDLPLKEISCNDVKVLFHDHNTKKVVYYNLYFNVEEINEDLPYYRLFTELLGKLGTSQYTSDQLASEVKMKIGKLLFDNHLYSGTVANCEHKVVVKIRTLEEKIAESLKLVHHVLTETEFENKGKMKEIIGNLVSNMKNQLENSGNRFAAMRVNSNLTNVGYKNERLRGISFYQFLVELEKDFEARYTALAEKMKELANSLFSTDNLIVGLTSDLSGMNKFTNAFLSFNLLEITQKEPLPFNLGNQVRKEAFANSNSILHVVQGGNINEIGYEFSGHMLVLEKILNLTYLWKNLRVLGGAYGGGISISMNGNLSFYSFRDPNLIETLEVFKAASDFVRNLDLSRSELEKYIIGTIADMDKPMNPRMKGEQADTNYFINYSYEKRAKVRNEVINTTVEDLRSLSKMFKALADRQSLCVVGNERKIEQHLQLFDSTQPLLL
ncbi:insulinase family protein [Cytobacillus firmus]|nr:insulinase family protein [Cytobacillus firmus]